MSDQAQQTEGETATESAEDADLESMTKAQLLEYAEEHGIQGVDGRLKKAEILEVIRNADAN